MKKLTSTSATTAQKRGAPRGSRNAAKGGRDLKYQMYMSKTRRGFFEEYFTLRFGRPPSSDDELRELARQIAEQAITHSMVEEFERHDPGSTTRGSSEVF
jgi:hypothetical protein